MGTDQGFLPRAGRAPSLPRLVVLAVLSAYARMSLHSLRVERSLILRIAAERQHRSGEETMGDKQQHPPGHQCDSARDPDGQQPLVARVA